MGKSNKKLPAKLPVWLYPAQVEVFYENALHARIDEQEKLINQILIQNLPSVILERDQDVPEDANVKTDVRVLVGGIVLVPITKFEVSFGGKVVESGGKYSNIKTDDYAESLERLILALTLSFDSIPSDTTVLAGVVAQQTNNWNDKEWTKQLNAAFGVDIFQREPWLNPTINSFVKENVSLITKMDSTLLSSVEETIQRGFTAGNSLTTIIKDIEKRVDVTRSHASLISRDQVGKLNGNLTRLRQTNLGVNSYVWRDADDVRVRPTHKAHDGKKFNWDNPPSNTGHPGNDYQCRCYAEADFEDVFEEIG